MPAFGTDGVGVGPLHAGVLDLVGKPQHRGNAGKYRGWRRGEPPICLVDDSARDTAALKRLLCSIRVDPIVAFGFVLCIDGLAMSDVRRSFLGDQRKGRVNRSRGRNSGNDGNGADGRNGQEVPPRRVDGSGKVVCRRVCGWRAKHAVSLIHWIRVLMARVRAEARSYRFPSACIFCKLKI